MVLSEHLTNDAGTFLVGIVAGVSNAEHTVKYASVYGLESVAHIGQGTGNDHRHTIVDV